MGEGVDLTPALFERLFKRAVKLLCPENFYQLNFLYSRSLSVSVCVYVIAYMHVVYM